MVPMEVSGVYTSAKSAYPQVVLEQKEGSAYLPIVIGRFEAAAISMAQSKRRPARPISYDLTQSILESVGARLERIEITDLHEGTYYAKVHMQDSSGRLIVMDSRPSDAIALALRMSAPIFASRSVLKEAGYVRPEEPTVADAVPAQEGCPTDTPDLRRGVGGIRAADALPAAGDAEAEPVGPLEVLKRRLDAAVAREAYEEAAHLRDEISGLEADTDG
jgi:uncharacterized protein